MTEAETPYARCICCGLDQPRYADATGVTARVCAQCTHHQGEQDVKRLARAERHERMLRERLEACRASESQTQLKAARDRAATAAALQSRGRLASRLVDAVGKSGNHRCPAQEIARDPDVVQWARREDRDGIWP
ncbi:MAG: hypothetical protein ACRDNT_01020 [Streptosporangiaceae bacterium]